MPVQPGEAGEDSYKMNILRSSLERHDGFPLIGVTVHEAVKKVRSSFSSTTPKFYILKGPRGVGKSRVTQEALKTLEGEGSSFTVTGSNPPTLQRRGSVLQFLSNRRASSTPKMETPLHPRFQVHIGSAGSQSGSDGSVTSCPPLQPLLKAIGKLVGRKRFQGAGSQFSSLLAADDAAGLTNLIPFLGGGSGGRDENGKEVVPDLNVLSDAILRSLKRYSELLMDGGTRLAIVLDDMEVCVCVCVCVRVIVCVLYALYIRLYCAYAFCHSLSLFFPFILIFPTHHK